MPANEVEVGVNTRHDIAEIQALDNALKQALDTARQLRNEMSAGSTPEQSTQYAGQLKTIAGLSGAKRAIEASVSAGGAATPQIATAGASAGMRQWSAAIKDLGSSFVQTPQAVQAAVVAGDAAGAMGIGTPQMVASIVRSVQAAQVGGFPPVVSGGVLSAMRGQQDPGNIVGPMTGMTYPQMMAAVAGVSGPGGRGGYGSSRAAMSIAYPLFSAGQSAIGGALELSTSLTKSGGTDEEAKARLVGTSWGATLGVPVGIATLALTRNPFLAMGASMAASALGSTIFGGTMGYFGAEKQQAFDTMALAGGVHAGTPFSQRTYSTFGMSGRLNELRADVNRDRPEWSHASLEGVARGWSTIAEGLSAGGQDPFGPGTARLYGGADLAAAARERAATNEWFRNSTGHYRLPGLMAGRSAEAIYAMRGDQGFGPETLSETYYRRLASIPGVGTKGATELSNPMARIMSRLPESGGSVADILASSNPRETAIWLSIQHENLRPDVSQRELEVARGTVGTAERRARIGGLRARGAGASVYGALGDELEAIGRLPGGKDSEIYASVSARRRDAGRSAFEAESIESYELPMTRLEGYERALEFMPYGPGNRYAVRLAMFGKQRTRARQLRAYMDQRKQRGELSESEELDLTKQIQDMQIGMARTVGALADPMVDRIAALSVGRVTGFNRFDSLQLAAIHAQAAGWPVRSFGAMGGKAAREQDEFARSAFGAYSDPYSTTQGFNTNGIESRLDTLIDLFSRVLGVGPGFVRGDRSGGLNGRELDSDSNKHAPFN